MSNTIKVQVPDLVTVMESYDQIKVYHAEAIDSTYLELDTIDLDVMDNLYEYIHTGGVPGEFYKVSFFDSSDDDESDLSDPINPADNFIQLEEDMQVVLTFDGSVADTDGNLLSAQEFFFTTKYNPYYSSVRKVRLEIGSFIQSLDDEAINFAIYEASLAADQLGWIKSTSDFYIWARREWVTCMASHGLLQNVISGLKSKRLDNFEVTYDAISRGQAILDKTQACMDKWEKELKSGGAAVQKPRMVVKGECDPDAPNVGRMWEKGPGTGAWPASNIRYRPLGGRRYIGGYLRNSTWRKLG